MIRRCPVTWKRCSRATAISVQQFVALKLDQLLALLAVEMVVLGIAVVVFVNGPAVELKSAKQPASTNSLSVR